MTTTVATRGNAPTSNRAGVWTLVGVQVGFAVLYAVGGWLALAHAAELTGQWHIPAQGDAATEGLDVAGSWGWAWPIGYVLQSAPVAAGLGLFVSIMAFLVGYCESRRQTYALIAGTVVTFAVLLVSLTPAAQSLSGWLLD